MLKDYLYTIKHEECISPNFMLYQIEVIADSEIYKAHFPQYPITPGVCLMQIAKELMEKYFESPLMLAQSRNIRYYRPVEPSITPIVDCNFTIKSQEDNTIKVDVNIMRDEELFAKMSLCFEKRK